MFSPKLGRRLSLGSYDAYRTWLVVEANPAIESFTERPIRIAGPSSAVIDFWVQLREAPGGEFWLIEHRANDGDEPIHENGGGADSVLHGLPVRIVRQSELRAWTVPITNWSRIVPYLVSYRRYRSPILEQAIVVYLSQPRSLDSIVERIADPDAGRVEAAVFALLASGHVISPDLAVVPLSGTTRFQRA